MTVKSADVKSGTGRPAPVQDLDIELAEFLAGRTRWYQRGKRPRTQDDDKTTNQ